MRTTIDINTIKESLKEFDYSIEETNNTKKEYLIKNNGEILAKIYASSCTTKIQEIEKIDFNIDQNDYDFENIFCKLYRYTSTDLIIKIKGNIRKWSCRTDDRFFYAVMFNINRKQCAEPEDDVLRIEQYLIHSLKIVARAEIDLIKFEREEELTFIEEAKLKLEKERKELSDLKKLLKKAQEVLQNQK